MKNIPFVSHPCPVAGIHRAKAAPGILQRDAKLIRRIFLPRHRAATRRWGGKSGILCILFNKKKKTRTRRRRAATRDVTSLSRLPVRRDGPRESIRGIEKFVFRKGAE